MNMPEIPDSVPTCRGCKCLSYDTALYHDWWCAKHQARPHVALDWKIPVRVKANCWEAEEANSGE